MFHLSLLNANKQQANDLIALFNNSSSENKVINTTKIFKETKADIKTLELVEDYTNLALQSVNGLSISNESKQIFIDFSNSLLERKL